MTSKTQTKPRCRRPEGIREVLDQQGQALARGHTVVGPVNHDALLRRQGVYVLAGKRPGGWWRPAKVGHGGDVWDRTQTVCAERWCANLDVQYFVLYTPGLREAARQKIEDAVRKALGL